MASPCRALQELPRSRPALPEQAKPQVRRAAARSDAEAEAWRTVSDHCRREGLIARPKDTEGSAGAGARSKDNLGAWRQLRVKISDSEDHPRAIVSLSSACSPCTIASSVAAATSVAMPDD